MIDRTVRIGVMGAGAVGCWFGGMLARAGHDVTLVGRAGHVEAILRDGLLMETPDFREHVRLHATTDASALRDADIVLFSVKSTATQSTAIQIAPLLSTGCTVVSLQNGVDNAECLTTQLRQPVLASVVRVATQMSGPGHVHQRGGGELTLPEGEAGRMVAGVLVRAGITVRLSANLPGEQWTKLTVNCALNALSAIAQKPFGPLLRVEGIYPLMEDTVLECLAVAQAEGIRLAQDPWEALQRSSSQAGQYSSMAQDHARGRRSEIDHLNGYVVQRGQALGVPTPVNRCLQFAIRLLEDRAA